MATSPPAIPIDSDGPSPSAGAAPQRIQLAAPEGSGLHSFLINLARTAGTIFTSPGLRRSLLGLAAISGGPSGEAAIREMQLEDANAARQQEFASRKPLLDSQLQSQALERQRL